MRSQLSQVLNRAQEIKDYMTALSEDERNFVRDILDPEPEQVEKPKQTRKPREAKQEKRGLPETKVSSGPCAVLNCGLPSDNPIHDPKGGYASYHEFQSAPSKKKAKVETPEVSSAAVA